MNDVSYVLYSGKRLFPFLYEVEYCLFFDCFVVIILFSFILFYFYFFFRFAFLFYFTLFCFMGFFGVIVDCYFFHWTRGSSRKGPVK